MSFAALFWRAAIFKANFQRNNFAVEFQARVFTRQAAGRDSSYRLATAILGSLLGQNKFFNRFFAENFLAHAPFFNYKKRIIRQRYEYIVYTPL